MVDIVSDPFEAARLILILRRAGVTENTVLSAMEDIPRDHFAREDTKSLAFEDAALPIDRGQTNLRPSLLARLLQFAEISDGIERVLLVGTGSGYLAAVLSRLVKTVHAIERHKHLFDQSQMKIDALGITNVECVHGDGLQGWPGEISFDRIVLTGLAVPAPVALLSQLSNEGWLIQPISADSSQQLVVSDASGNRLKSMEVMGFQPLLSGIIGE